VHVEPAALFDLADAPVVSLDVLVGLGDLRLEVIRATRDEREQREDRARWAHVQIL
jgi:hypothetical protein